MQVKSCKCLRFPTGDFFSSSRATCRGGTRLSASKNNMSTAEYDAITTLSEDLCNALPINDLFPSLISKQVIDFNDKAEICSESIERRRVELFISKLIGRIKTGDSEKFYKFMEVLKESPKCVDLQNRMEQLRVLNQHFDGKSARESQSENSKSLQQSSGTYSN